MTKYSTIINHNIEKCKPTKIDYHKLEKIKRKSLELLQQTIDEKNYVVEIIPGGSYPKDTWVKNDVDLDIFLKFDRNISRSNFEKQVIDIGMTSFASYNPYLRYSEHPYVETYVNKIRINVVGCFDIKQGEKVLSNADRSIFHTEFINSRLTNKQKDNVRLLKLFLKTFGLYGSEIKTKGFSGYVCELLILKNGSFLDVLRNVVKNTNIDDKYVVCVEKSHEAYSVIHDYPIVILDPVDPKRNLGSAISLENYFKFLFMANAFLKNPSNKFFSKRRKHIKNNQLIMNNIVILKFSHDKRSSDILWGQLLRSIIKLENKLKKHGFNVIKRSAVTNEDDSSSFIFLLEDLEISSLEIRKGPFVNMFLQSSNFIQKNRDSMLKWINEEGKIIMVKTKNMSNIKDYLVHVMSMEFNTLGLSSGFSDISKNYEIIYGKKIISYSKKHKWLGEGISEFIQDESIFDICK